MIKVTSKIHEKEIFESREWKRRSEAFFELISNDQYPGKENQKWLSVDKKYFDKTFKDINEVVDKMTDNYDFIVASGIGGSYHAAKAFAEARFGLHDERVKKMIYVGNHLSPDHIQRTLQKLKNRKFLLVVISKSGGTFETAVCFRLFYNLLKQNFPREYREYVVVITHEENGKLRKIANHDKLLSLSIPDGFEGRYTVLTPVGLFLLKILGLNIKTLCFSFLKYRKLAIKKGIHYQAYKYGMLRYEYGKNFPVETMAVFESEYESLQEWVISLFSENEGKDGLGSYMDHVLFTRELHNLGIFFQEGTKIQYETMWWFNKSKAALKYIVNDNDFDGTNIAGNRKISEINYDIYNAVVDAHSRKHNVIEIHFDNYHEETLGEIICFFYFASIFSSYLLNVIAHITSYNDPNWGVDVYKNLMNNNFEKNKSKNRK